MEYYITPINVHRLVRRKLTDWESADVLEDVTARES